MLQLAAHGTIRNATPASLASLRDAFVSSRCVCVPSFIEPRLLSRIQGQVAGAAFADRAHGSISTERCMTRNACLGLLNFLANDPALFRFVEEVTSCPRLTSFVGRVYRLLAGSGHYDSWHADLHRGHEVGMSVNLGAEPFEGGVFEIRRAGSSAVLFDIANVGPGDAILFAISDDLEHRVTPMRGEIAKTAFAGWFGSTGDYRDVVHHETVRSAFVHPRRVS
jgi:hypothetical protein